MFPPRLNTSQKIYVEAKMKILQMITNVIQKVKAQSWQRGPNHLFYEDPPTLPTSPFSKFCSTLPFPCCLQSPPPLLFYCLVFCLNGELHHILCAVLLNYIMDLHMSSLRTLVPEGSSCVFYVARSQVY